MLESINSKIKMNILNNQLKNKLIIKDTKRKMIRESLGPTPLQRPPLQWAQAGSIRKLTHQSGLSKEAQIG